MQVNISESRLFMFHNTGTNDILARHFPSSIHLATDSTAADPAGTKSSEGPVIMLWNVQDALTCLIGAFMASTGSWIDLNLLFWDWNVRSRQPLACQLDS